MESPEPSSLTALEILATSLVMRLTLDELEWLERKLAEYTQERRRKAPLRFSIASSRAESSVIR